MNDCEIYFSENDELTEMEVQQKEWRGDIIVKIAGDLFKPIVITPSRLFIDFNYSINEGRIYEIEPNLILVKKTDRVTIIETLLKLTKIGYFSKIEPVDLKQEYAKCFQELQDLKNWVKVY